jgi:hypothetical protein
VGSEGNCTCVVVLCSGRCWGCLAAIDVRARARSKR